MFDIGGSNSITCSHYYRARLLLQKESSNTGLATPQKSQEQEDIPEIKTPEGLRKNTFKYWKWKATAAMDYAKGLKEVPVTPEEVVPELFSLRKVNSKPKRKSVRVTQVHGSMEAGKVLEKVMEKRQEEEMIEEGKRQKRREKENREEQFKLCEVTCVCGEKPCVILGMKKCTSCQRVLKSQCQQRSCVNADGERPKMIIPACNKKPQLSVSDVFSSASEDEDSESSFNSDEDEQDVSAKHAYPQFPRINHDDDDDDDKAESDGDHLSVFLPPKKKVSNRSEPGSILFKLFTKSLQSVRLCSYVTLNIFCTPEVPSLTLVVCDLVED